MNKLCKFILTANEYTFIFIFAVILLSLAFVFTFLGCALIEYNNCDGDLSFSHYDYQLVDISIAVLPAPGPVFGCIVEANNG